MNLPYAILKIKFYLLHRGLPVLSATRLSTTTTTATATVLPAASKWISATRRQLSTVRWISTIISTTRTVPRSKPIIISGVSTTADPFFWWELISVRGISVWRISVKLWGTIQWGKWL